MKWASHKKKVMGSLAFVLFTVTGTYNAVVINSESLLSSTDVRFVKRLDEVYGVTRAGSRNAASIQWQKVSSTNSAPMRAIYAPYIAKTNLNPSGTDFNDFSKDTDIPAAAVQESLSLTLNEVVNSKKWPSGLPNTQFNGNLSTNNGVIESLSVSLPNGENISVAFSEMAGNVFEYDMDNHLYSGMMYQVDQHSYMVTLTNGPMEGTRLRFVGEPSSEQKAALDDQIAETEISKLGNSDTTDLEAQQLGLAQQEQSPTDTAVEPQVDLPAPEVADVQEEPAPELQAQSENMDGQSEAM